MEGIVRGSEVLYVCLFLAWYAILRHKGCTKLETIMN